jgi:hypothetical protein
MMSNDSLDTILKLVANRHRRQILAYVRHSDTHTVRIDTLVEQLYQAEPSGDRQLTRTQLTMQLTHTHLPKLAGHGLIDHNHDQGTITYHPDERIERVLDGLPIELPQTHH